MEESPELGKLRGETVKVYNKIMDKNAVPIFYKARSVLYVMKEKIEDELQ
jgi:hypothetical protein